MTARRAVDPTISIGPLLALVSGSLFGSGGGPRRQLRKRIHPPGGHSSRDLQPLARMVPLMHRGQVLDGEARVDLRRGDGGVAQDRLHMPQVGAALQQVRGGIVCASSSMAAQRCLRWEGQSQTGTGEVLHWSSSLGSKVSAGRSAVSQEDV